MAKQQGGGIPSFPMQGMQPEQPIQPQPGAPAQPGAIPPTGTPPGNPPATAPLTQDQRNHWNLFVDYLDRTGYKGSNKLDNTNMALGQGLLAKFNQANPGSQINYDDVPRIQGELNNYRTQVLNQWKAGKAAVNIKNEDEFMPGLSKQDGWLGSKTSSYKFPAAILNNKVVGTMGVNDVNKPLTQIAMEQAAAK